MTWTYLPSQLALAHPLDVVRLLVGDTNVDDQLLQDEEIGWIAQAEGLNPYRIGSRAAEAIASKFSRQSDKMIGGIHGLRDTGSQKSKQYSELACRLRLKALRSGPVPVPMGLSISNKVAVEDETDRVPNLFRREEFIIAGTEGSILNQDIGVPSE